jgi:hypothetical protein
MSEGDIYSLLFAHIQDILKKKQLFFCKVSIPLIGSGKVRIDPFQRYRRQMNYAFQKI